MDFIRPPRKYHAQILIPPVKRKTTTKQIVMIPAGTIIVNLVMNSNYEYKVVERNGNSKIVTRHEKIRYLVGPIGCSVTKLPCGSIWK